MAELAEYSEYSGALDISDIVMYRKRLGRASMAGAVFALIQLAASVSYFLAVDCGFALLYICSGVVGFALSLRLGKGSLCRSQGSAGSAFLGLDSDRERVCAQCREWFVEREVGD